MATQAVNTILQTIGGAERLQTGVAERVATKKYDEAMQQQQDRIAREQAALDSIAELRSITDLPPTMQRAIQGQVDSLYEQVKKGELDVNDINQRVGQISGKHNSYKNLYENYKATLEERLKNPDKFQSLQEGEDGFSETTDEMMNMEYGIFFGDGVYDEESDPANLRGISQALVEYAPIDLTKGKEIVENYVKNNWDKLMESPKDIGAFYEKIETGELQPLEAGELREGLKTQLTPQLIKDYARGRKNGLIGADVSQQDYIDRTIESLMPGTKTTETLVKDDVDAALRIEKGKQILETPNYSIDSGLLPEDASMPEGFFSSMGAERTVEDTESGRKYTLDDAIITYSRTQRSGKEEKPTQISDAKGGSYSAKFGRSYYNPKSKIMGIEITPETDQTISIKVPKKFDDDEPIPRTAKRLKDGTVIDKNGNIILEEKTINTSEKQGQSYIVYANLATGENVDIAQQYAKSSRASLSDITGYDIELIQGEETTGSTTPTVATDEDLNELPD